MAKKLQQPKKKNHTKRAKKIERAIRLTWLSLESHLEYTYKKDSAGLTFHKNTIRDYAEIIQILSELY